MRIKKVIQMFEDGNVSVCGLRGTGKDMLTSNVIVRRRKPYVSNIDYTQDLMTKPFLKDRIRCMLRREKFVPVKMYQKLDFDKLDMGGTTYKDLINGTVYYYEFPYIKGSDIYVSDAGIYFPSQFCNELNRDYKFIPLYAALSRQISKDGNFHCNSQALGRVYDKLREQSEIYIRCRSCKVLFGKLVVQRITLYDKYQSCVDRVEPCRIGIPLMASREVKQNAKMYCDKFRNSYGSIKNRLLIYVNKSSYDTYYFEKLFAEGIKNDKK